MNCLQLYLLTHNLSPSLSMHINVSKVSPPALLGPKDEKALTSLVALNLWPFQWLTSQTSPEVLSSLLTACEGPSVQPVRQMIKKGHLRGLEVTKLSKEELRSADLQGCDQKKAKLRDIQLKNTTGSKMKHERRHDVCSCLFNINQRDIWTNSLIFKRSCEVFKVKSLSKQGFLGCRIPSFHKLRYNAMYAYLSQRWVPYLSQTPTVPDSCL